jgi:hypothetical protein
VRESNPQERFRLRQFSGLLGMPVPNLPRVAGAPGFEPESAGLESASLALSLHPPTMHQEGFEPPRSHSSHSFTGCRRAVSASDARFCKLQISRLFGEKQMKAGGRAHARLRTREATAPAFITSRYFGCQTTKERAGLLASPQEAGPLRTSLYELLEIWEREARPR